MYVGNPTPAVPMVRVPGRPPQEELLLMPAEVRVR